MDKVLVTERIEHIHSTRCIMSISPPVPQYSDPAHPNAGLKMPPLETALIRDLKLCIATEW
jgi:hypothetical protein